MARTHVVMADDVMEAVDRLVGERGRSRFLEEAVRKKLARVELEETLRATAGTVSALSHPEWRDRQSTAAWVSSIRKDSSS